MPATGLIFTVGPTMITVDDSGAVTDVRHADDHGHDGGQLIDRFAAGGSVTDVRRDEDEVEVLARHGSATVSLRQSFAAGWTTRIMIDGGAGDTSILLPLTVPGGVTPWLVCTGSEGWLVLLSGSAGPLLTARVTAGSLTDVTPEGLVLGLGPHRSEAHRPLTLQWDWAGSPAELLPRLPAGLPPRGVWRDGSDVVLESDPDTAVTAEVDLTLAESEDGAEVLVIGDSRTPRALSYHSARGTTATRLRWAATDAELLRAAAEKAMQGTRTSAGVVRVPDLPTALVLQHVVATAPTGTDPALVDALDLFTARAAGGPTEQTGEPDQGEPAWWCSYLVAEFQRLGDVDLLDQAAVRLRRAVEDGRASARVPAGIGLAAARLAVALLLSGRPAPDPPAAVSALVTEHPDPSALPWWEARLITDRLVGPRRLSGLEQLIGFGRRLGAGLPGAAVRPMAVADQAQLITVLRLVPEGLQDRLGREWGIGLAELIERAGAELSARLDGLPPERAHGWLVVADPSV